MTNICQRKGGVKSHGRDDSYLLCGDGINAAYVTNVIWCRFALFVAIDKGLYPKYIDIFYDFYLILRLRIIGQCHLSLYIRVAQFDTYCQNFKLMPCQVIKL